MKKRELGDYIQDILEALGEVEDFTIGMQFEDFVKDKKTINAVVRSLEVIGEATKKIPDSLRVKHSKIPWKRMAGMRDKLIHEYFGVDLEIVWEVINNELPPVKPLIQKVLENIEGETKDSRFCRLWCSPTPIGVHTKERIWLRCLRHSAQILLRRTSDTLRTLSKITVFLSKIKLGAQD